MKQTIPDEIELIRQLRDEFPAMYVRPLREYGLDGYEYGAWIAGENDCVMPDGNPVFSSYCCEDPDVYDGQQHKGFSQWLEERGWYTEMADAGVFMAIPIIYAKMTLDAVNEG